MLIILWMWTRHTQKGRFSLQCHQEISKILLENFTYKSFWVFFPQFSIPDLQSLPRTGGSCRAVTDFCRAPHVLRNYGCASCSWILARAAPSANLPLYSAFQQLKVQEEKLCICVSSVVVEPLRKIVCLHVSLWSLHMCWDSDFVHEKSKYLCKI